MNQGGIFSGPTALGIAGLGETGTSCTPDNTGLIKTIQTYLRGHGAPNVKVDGVWQGCTASAWNKVIGHPYVTCEDIKNVTGLNCSSDDCGLAGIIASLSVPAMFQCTDGSDGVPAGGGGQQCPEGQAWNATLGYCIPTGIPGTTTPTTTTPAAGGCPAGQTGIPPFCFGTATGGGTTPASSTGCPAGQTGIPPLCFTIPTGGGSQPTECPAGTIKNPIDGSCIGSTGIQTATECPAGQTKDPIFGKCWTNPLATKTDSSSGGCPAGQSGFPPFCFAIPGTSQPQGGACPAGQMNIPLLGCVTNPMGGGSTSTGGPSDIFGGLMTTITGLLGGGGVSCPAGSVYNPATKGCTSASGPVEPVPGGTPGSIVAPATTSSVFGGMGWVIVSLLGVGAAATGYWYYKKHQQDGGFDDMSGMDMGMDEFGMDDYGYELYQNRRRGRKSRKGKGRRSRRRGCR